jgi:uncharacterized protein YndB with AHSA1/START domain
MVKVSVNRIMEAPVEKVWETIQSYDSLVNWHAAIASSLIENEKGSTELGAVRKVVMHDGAVIREVLIGWSNEEHMYKYKILECPFPITNFEATLKCTKTSDGDNCFVEWISNEFDTPHDQKEAMRTLAETVFTLGFEGIALKVIKA